MRLNFHSDSRLEQQWDAIIVGSGPAGTLVAELLVERGLQILILEAGPRPKKGIDIPAIDDNVWQFETPGYSCDWLRVRAVGGGSLAWGGWSNRFPESVFRKGCWPCDTETLRPFYVEAERRINVVEKQIPSHFKSLNRTLDVTVLPMGSSNISGTAWSSKCSPVSSSIHPDTVATRMMHDGAGASSLQVVAADSTIYNLSARSIIMAASPIETARLLLASGLGELCPRIGCNLTYHPIAGYALIESKGDNTDPTGAALIPPDELPNALVGPDFSVEITGPFDLASLDHELRERICPDGEPSMDSCVTFIHAMGELRPSQRRRVDLSPVTRDSLGRAVPRIHLAWSRSEIEWVNKMKHVVITIAEALATNGGELIEYLDPIEAPMLFHEAGTCSMGTSYDSPCNPKGRLNVLQNVWVADASVFPSAGDRHPTLTILALALRTATSVAEWLESSST